MEKRVGESLVRLVLGDITREPADLMVNAANSAMAGGGGVDGAIHRAGGPSIMEELRRVRPIGGCPAGSGVVTNAGALPAKHVFHAVGPVWRGGSQGEPKALACAYTRAMRTAADLRAAKVTFPSISTGVYGYPVDLAAPTALGAVAAELGLPTTVKEVVFVLFDEGTLRAYETALSTL